MRRDLNLGGEKIMTVQGSNQGQWGHYGEGKESRLFWIPPAPPFNEQREGDANNVAEGGGKFSTTKIRKVF